MEVLVTDEVSISDPLRRALDALVDGQPIPDDARARLTDAEHAHLSGLVAASALTRIVLQSPVPSAPAEAASLQKAQARVAARPASGPPRREGWFSRWRNRGNKGGTER